MKQAYIHQRFEPKSLAMIETVNDIIDTYKKKGFSLTLRQIYYRLVTKNLIENSVPSYKRLGNILNLARLSGLVDWDAIEDRSRNLIRPNTWDSPGDIIRACADQYKGDRWSLQPRRIEVWVEKLALIDVVQKATAEFDVPYFTTRGYNSQSEFREAAIRLKNYRDNGQDPLVIYLGDFDPSGKDISRDMNARFKMFVGGIDVNRIALNMPQIERYKLPPNPAKPKDSRYKKYYQKYGKKCWELDALEPEVLVSMIQRTIKANRDQKLWDKAIKREEPARRKLINIAKNVK